MDLFPQFWSGSTISQRRIQWMSSGIDAAIGADKSSGANAYQAGIDHDEIEVNKDSFAQPYIGAIINANWRLNPRIVIEKLLVFFGIGRLGWQARNVHAVYTVEESLF
jgi:hypothetical protein